MDLDPSGPILQQNVGFSEAGLNIVALVAQDLHAELVTVVSCPSEGAQLILRASSVRK